MTVNTRALDWNHHWVDSSAPPHLLPVTLKPKVSASDLVEVVGLQAAAAGCKMCVADVLR